MQGIWLGCAAWVAHPEDGAECQVGDSASIVFRAASGIPTEAHWADDTKLIEMQAEGENVRLSLGTRSGVVVVRSENAEARVLIRHVTPPAWLVSARRLRSEGHVEAALSMVQAHVGADIDGGLAHSLAARLELALGKVERAVPHFEAAIAQAHRDGILSQEVDDSCALVFALVERSESLEKAKSRLDDVEKTRVRELYPEGAARLPFYRALVALAYGHLAEAQQLLGDSAKLAQGASLRPLARNARSSLAQLHLRTGRRVQATTQLRTLLADAITPCEQMESLSNLGHAEMMATEAEDARAHFEQASRLQCSDAHLAAVVWINLAEARALVGDAQGAEAALRRVPTTTLKLEERLSMRHTEGLLAARKGESQRGMQMLYDAFVQARRARLLDVAIRMGGSWGKVQCQVLPRRCVAGMREVEQVLDEAVQVLPVTLGQGAYVEGQGESTRVLVERLPPAEALTVARQAALRRRHALMTTTQILQQPDHEAERVQYHASRIALERSIEEEWTLPSNVLQQTRAARSEHLRLLEQSLLLKTPPPLPTLSLGSDPGTLVVSSPIEKGYRILLAQGNRVYAWSHVTGQALPPALIAAVRREGREVRVLPSQFLQSLPWETWLRPNASLLMSLDLGGMAAHENVAPMPVQHVVLVGDPAGDLPYSRQEAMAIDALLPQSVRRTVYLGTSVTFEGLTHEIALADWLHFAGHSAPAPESGSAFGAFMPLGVGGRIHLRTSDILALRRAPQTVVLLSCEAAKEGESLGIAQAFVFAGSKAVVASTHSLADTEAKEIAEGLYRSIADGGFPSSAAGLSRLLLEVGSGRGPGTPLRVYVP